MSDVYLDIGKIVLVYPKTQQMYCYVNSLKRIMPCYSLERFFFNRRNAFCVSKIKGLVGMNVIVAIVKHLQACWLIGILEEHDIPNENELKKIAFNEELTKEKYLNSIYYRNYVNNILSPHAGFLYLSNYKDNKTTLFHKSVYFDNNKVKVGPITTISPNLSQIAWSSGLDFHQIGYFYDGSFINRHFETKYDSGYFVYTFTYEKLKSTPFHIIIKFKKQAYPTDKCPIAKGVAEFVSASYQYFNNKKLINLRLYATENAVVDCMPVRVYYPTEIEPFSTYTDMCWYKIKQQLLQPITPYYIGCSSFASGQAETYCTSKNILLPENELTLFVSKLGFNIYNTKAYAIDNFNIIIGNTIQTQLKNSLYVSLSSTIIYPPNLAIRIVKLPSYQLSPYVFAIPRNRLFSISNINALVQNSNINRGLRFQDKYSISMFYK